MMKNETYDVQEIKQRLDMVAFAQEHFGGRAERHGAETHLVGAGLGGFRLNTVNGLWRHEVADVGGDVLDLVGYALHGAAYFNDRRGHFADVLAEAARVVGLFPVPRDRSIGLYSNRSAETRPSTGTGSRTTTGNEAETTTTMNTDTTRTATSGPAGRRSLVAVYPYHDADGVVLFEVRKYAPRGYAYRRYTDDGTPVLGIDADDYVMRNGVWVRTRGAAVEGARTFGDAPRVLYRLPEVRAAVADGRTVFIVEGEKDVETVRSLGITATTNPMGAGKWRDAYADELRGADVVVLPDNDEPGRRHALRVARSLNDVAANVRVLDLPGLPPRGDVSDWVAAGGTADELLTLADAAACPIEGGMMDPEEHERAPETAWPSATAASHGNERSAYPLLPRDPFSDLSDEEERALVIPAAVYDALPPALQRLTNFFAAGHERDAFLTAALPVLGAAMVNTVGTRRYDCDPLAIYTAVVALPGAGKGVLRFANRLGGAINRRLLTTSANERAEWTMRLKSKDGDAGPEPAHRAFFIAGNASKRAMIDDLDANDGVGMIFETEIGTIANTIGQDWGDIADVFLRAFHCEPLLLSRKGDDKVFVERPALFIALSGTPGAFSKLIPTTEDGLFSRFALYWFQSTPRWISQEPVTGFLPGDTLFDEAAAWLDDAHRDLSRRSTPLAVCWAPAQWGRLNTVFADALARLIASRADVTLEATIKRLGLLAFRVGCVLALVRAYHDGQSLQHTTWLTVEAVDAETAITLALVYFRHALRFAATMPRTSGPRLRGMIATFFAQLPEGAFGRAEYRAAAERAGTSERTAQRYLVRLVDSGTIVDLGYGRYWKPTATEPHVSGGHARADIAPDDDAEFMGSHAAPPNASPGAAVGADTSFIGMN